MSAPATTTATSARGTGAGLRRPSAVGAFGIGATFIGTTIGAGYASGQEILQYFVSFGPVRGPIALAIATVLFFLLGWAVLWLAHRLRTDDIHDLVNPVDSRWPTRFVDLSITVSLFGTLVIMLAGAGAAIELQTGIPAIVGSAIMAAVCVVSILAGTSGLVIVQKIVVPLIIVVAVGVAAWAIVNAGPSTGQAAADMVNSSPLINNWMLSGVLYVAFNIQLVYAVFAPVGKESKGGLTLFSGALLGALGIGVMAGAMVWALSANAAVVGTADLPMVELAATIAPWAMVVYSIVLLLAQFTTAVSCLFGSVERFRKAGPITKLPNWLVAVLTGALAVLLSAIGFSSLIGTVYPILGYAGLVIIVLLVATFIVRHRRGELSGPHSEDRAVRASSDA
ncbi:hypothetical protein M3F63_02260 [Brachybacterium muris]|uniref:YkvI family membrane protein n=1 Tax=Brachybacterium muris TaxID=219301 RepID=UPI00223AE19E|nr:hypothetical protein [Brachybacterium muris]MCT2176499.1 hypothetical protein [Brachybacterium muris]